MKRILLYIGIGGGVLVLTLIIVVSLFGGGHTVVVSAMQTPPLINATTGEPLPNLTEAVTESLAKAIVDNNPLGPQPDPEQPGMLTINPIDAKTISQDVLRQHAEKMTAYLSSLRPDPKDIFIDKQVSVKTYLLARDKILNAQRADLRGYELKEFDDATMQVMYSASDKALTKLKALSIPPELVAVHTEQLRLFMVQQAIFKSIMQRKTDPFAAQIALNALAGLSNDTEKLQAAFKAFATKP